MFKIVRGAIILAIAVALLLVVGWLPSFPEGSRSGSRPEAPTTADAASGQHRRRGPGNWRQVADSSMRLLATCRQRFRSPAFSSALFADEADDADGGLARRRKAPSLDGGAAWINTGGPIDLKQLRGKFVLLDFWTYCCINCMHILPELKSSSTPFPTTWW